MTVAEAQRRCASAGGCVHREREDPNAAEPRWLGALLTEPEGVCGACLSRLEAAITDLPRDVLELTALIGATGTPGETQVSRSREIPVPIRLGIEALRAEIDFELTYWAEIVADVSSATLEDLQHCRVPVRIYKASRFLALRVHTLLGLGPQERTVWSSSGEPGRDAFGYRDTVEYSGLAGALYLAKLHQRVRRVAGRTRLVHRLTPACPYCDHKALIRHNGASHVECESCGKPIAEKHYSWFVRVTVAEEQRRLAVA